MLQRWRVPWPEGRAESRSPMMNADRFDALARSLGATGSRRAALPALAAALGGAVAALRPGSIAAGCRRPCGSCRRCKNGRCRPKPNGAACGLCRLCTEGQCQTAGDGTACGDGGVCSGGQCEQGCSTCAPVSLSLRQLNAVRVGGEVTLNVRLDMANVGDHAIGDYRLAIFFPSGLRPTDVSALPTSTSAGQATFRMVERNLGVDDGTGVLVFRAVAGGNAEAIRRSEEIAAIRCQIIGSDNYRPIWKHCNPANADCGLSGVWDLGNNNVLGSFGDVWVRNCGLSGGTCSGDWGPYECCKGPCAGANPANGVWGTCP